MNFLHKSQSEKNVFLDSSLNEENEEENEDLLNTNYKNTSNLEKILDQIDNLKNQFKKQILRQNKQELNLGLNNKNTTNKHVVNSFKITPKLVQVVRKLDANLNNTNISNEYIRKWLNIQFHNAKSFEYVDRKTIDFIGINTNYKILLSNCSYILFLKNKDVTQTFIVWIKNQQISKIKPIKKWNKMLFHNSFFSIFLKTFFATMILVMAQLFILLPFNGESSIIGHILNSLKIDNNREPIFYILGSIGFIFAFFIFFCLPILLTTSKTLIKSISFVNILFILAIFYFVIRALLSPESTKKEELVPMILFLIILFTFIILDIAFIIKCWRTKY